MQRGLFIALAVLPLACATTEEPAVQEVVVPTTEQTKPTTLVDVEDLHDSHFVGIFQNDRLKKSYPAALDLVVRHNADNDSEMAGVLRIYAPTQEETASYRVISSYYERIALRDQELSFAVKQQRIRVVKKGSWEQDKITAFVVVYGFGQGQLHLYKQARADFSLPSPPAQRPLELSTFKLQRTKFPQRVFVEQGAVKVETGLLNTSKNLLKRDLFDVNYASIDRFGIYYGVLHHEQLNAFQYLRLAFVEDREAGTTTAISTLFFAQPQQQEFVVYHHQAGREVMRGTTPVLLGDDSDSEAFLLFNKWNKRGIRGVWYSKAHGRIGQIFLMRERFPRLETTAALVPNLHGRRQGKRFVFDLQVHNGIAQQGGKASSTKISGTLNDILQEKTYQITAGNYDFYRGLVELTYEGGSVYYSVFE